MGERIFTSEELSKYNATDESLPVYLAIKGVVYDVSISREMYTPPKGYSVFSGKDASKALGMSSLKPEDCIADYSSLNEEEMKTLDKWVDFFAKKYPVVGRME
jgi:membrane-associated progesterone receptor component